MTEFTFTKVFEGADDGTAALDAAYMQANLDTAFVQDNNRFYRYFSADLTPGNGTAVVRPKNLSDAEPGRWFVQGPPGPVFNPAVYEVPIMAAFDYFIRSRADLIAVAGEPVADVFTLPAGRYSIAKSFSLNADERMEVEAGVSVEFISYRGATISGDTTNALLRVEGGLFKGFGFILSNAGTGQVVLAITAAEVSLEQCRLLGTAGTGLSVFASEVFLAQTDLVGGPALHVQSGTARLSTCNLNSILSGSAITNSTGVLFLEDCTVNSITASPAVDLSLGAAYCTGCDFFADSAPHVIETGTGTMKISGGSITGAANTGISVGNVDSLIVQGVRFESLTLGIQGVGTGPADQVVLDSCSFNTTTGVDFTDGSTVPANGLLETSLVMDCTTAFVNHVETDARVNRKACTNAGALLAETPIVP